MGERFLGGGERVIDVLERAFVKGRLEFRFIEGADGPEGMGAAFGRDAGDDAFTVEIHKKWKISGVIERVRKGRDQRSFAPLWMTAFFFKLQCFPMFRGRQR